jgi:MarR family transcriptional regulator, transcriptional regulator for hemolysin
MKDTTERPTGESVAATGEPAGDMFVLLEAARNLQGRLDAALESAGLSAAKYAALEKLARSGKPLTLGELAGCLQCARSNITQLVDRLEAEGLVERVDDEHDRRAIRARVTALGVERFTTAEWAIRGVQSELEARVPVEERSLFRRVLSSLR